MERHQHDLSELFQSIRTPVRGRSVHRKCNSATVTSEKARAWFSSPDRFLSPRAESTERENVFRVSKSPQSLSPSERRTRYRGAHASPFAETAVLRSQNAAHVRRFSASGRQGPPHFTPSFVHGHEVSTEANDTNDSPDIQRQISFGAVWNVGGPAAARGGPRLGVHDGHGGLLASGTTGPMHTAHFLGRSSPTREAEQHQDRLALALEIDRANRVLGPIATPSPMDSIVPGSSHARPYSWRNNCWEREEGTDPRQKISSNITPRMVPTLPFRVLDAPRLRDDFYCSTLAYSHTCRTLAVGLSSRVYLWSEEVGVRAPPIVSNRSGNYVTSLSFSSEEGGKAILAVGRQNGLVSLVNPLEEGRPRFQVQKSCPVSCLAFKPTVSIRYSGAAQNLPMACEDLLIGDDVGELYYYSIEWPEMNSQPDVLHSRGRLVQLARITAHSQQICGLAWSPDGKFFASGGNDNAAHLFDVAKVLQTEPRRRGRSLTRLGTSRRDPEPGPYPHSPPMSPERQGDLRQPSLTGRRSTVPTTTPLRVDVDRAQRIPPIPIMPPLTSNDLVLTPPTSPTRGDGDPQTPTDHRIVTQPSPGHHSSPLPYTQPSGLLHGPGLQSHAFSHSAAVKAIAFAPWQASLLATGGGSNDRQIHFFHAGSGATLALINVAAQVTSLIWSKTKRELCATFGYAQPEHGVRIAVFAWPSGECVVRIPWGNQGDGLSRTANDANSGGTVGGRALWAVAFPGGPNDDRVREGQRRGQREGRGATDESATAATTQQREGQRWGSRTHQEGCIVVAGSDESVKFHEVWTGEAPNKAFFPSSVAGSGGSGFGLDSGATGFALGNARGVLGGSIILEAAHGIEDEFWRTGTGIGTGRGIGGGGGREVIR